MIDGAVYFYHYLLCHFNGREDTGEILIDSINPIHIGHDSVDIGLLHRVSYFTVEANIRSSPMNLSLLS